MTTNAPHPTELLAAYALDALEPDERAAVEAHVAGCAACRAEVARLTAVADVLAETIAPVPPPPGARGRLMARVAAERARSAAEGTTAVAVTDPVSGAPRVLPPASRPQPGAGAWAATTVTAGAIALAAFTSWQAVAAQREVAALRTEAAQLAAQLREQADALAEISPANPTGAQGPAAPRVTALQGGGQAVAAGGRLVYQPSGRVAIALLERLPPLQPGHVYQLWLLRGTTPMPAGTFTVDGAGRASAVLRAPERLDSYTGIGLTAEPAPGGASPTGPILVSGSLAPS